MQKAIFDFEPHPILKRSAALGWMNCRKTIWINIYSLQILIMIVSLDRV